MILAWKSEAFFQNLSGDMSGLFGLKDPFFPKSHGKPRVDAKRVVSGTVFITRDGSSPLKCDFCGYSYTLVNKTRYGCSGACNKGEAIHTNRAQDDRGPGSDGLAGQHAASEYPRPRAPEIGGGRTNGWCFAHTAPRCSKKTGPRSCQNATHAGTRYSPLAARNWRNRSANRGKNRRPARQP